MYHFSGPRASLNPPEEFELSDPLLCLPRFIGVEARGGDIDMCEGASGVPTAGDRDKGEPRCVDATEAAATAADIVVAGFIVVDVIGDV